MKKEKKTAVPKASPVKLERILVPIDFSDASEHALSYAITLAAKFEARITLIHVVEIISGPVDPAFGYVPENNEPQAGASAKRLENLAADKVPAALLAATLVRSGVPYHEVTAAAKELKTDLIVISTHGYTGFMHVLLGSTAERIVRHAPCPVLTVRSR